MSDIVIFEEDWIGGIPSYGIMWRGGEGGMERKILVTPIKCDRSIMEEMLTAFRAAFKLGLYEASVQLNYLRLGLAEGKF